MNPISPEMQDMADALEICVRGCADNPEFVAEFNRLSDCHFPHGGEGELREFVVFVGEFVLLPLIHQWNEDTAR